MAEHWVKDKHQHHAVLQSQEKRQRASYLATKDVLVPFLVPHRFEGKDIDPLQPFITRIFKFLNDPGKSNHAGDLNSHICV